MRLPWSMAALLTFALAAAVASSAAPPASPKDESRGVRLQVSATVTIVRAATASESAAPGEVTRHVTRRADGTSSINFE